MSTTSSILTNSSALTALQALQMTEQSLNQTQTEISTGLRVNSASDNAAYWSISTQMKSDNGVLGAVSDSLGETSSVLGVANAALTSVISTINNIKNDLANAASPTADLTSINADLAEQGKALQDAVTGASFNGTNLLNGSGPTSLNFVSGFQQTAAGATFDTINVTAQSLYSGSTATTTTVAAPQVNGTANVASIQGLVDNSTTVATASFGQDRVVNGTSGSTNNNADQISVTSVDINGVSTTTTYTGINATTGATTTNAAAATAFSVQVSTTAPAGTGLLKQGASDLTNLNVTSGNVDQMAIDVGNALKAVTAYASTLGSTQSRVNSQSTFISSLSNALTTGVSSLVDADMNEASTRLQALQTQQQLGIQSLAIANQNSQLILKLFGA